MGIFVHNEQSNGITTLKIGEDNSKLPYTKGFETTAEEISLEDDHINLENNTIYLMSAYQRKEPLGTFVSDKFLTIIRDKDGFYHLLDYNIFVNANDNKAEKPGDLTNAFYQDTKECCTLSKWKEIVRDFTNDKVDSRFYSTGRFNYILDETSEDETSKLSEELKLSYNQAIQLYKLLEIGNDGLETDNSHKDQVELMATVSTNPNVTPLNEALKEAGFDVDDETPKSFDNLFARMAKKNIKLPQNHKLYPSSVEKLPDGILQRTDDKGNFIGFDTKIGVNAKLTDNDDKEIEIKRREKVKLCENMVKLMPEWSWKKWNNGGYDGIKGMFVEQVIDLIYDGLISNLRDENINIDFNEHENKLKIMIGRIDAHYGGIISINLCYPNKYKNFEKDMEKFEEKRLHHNPKRRHVKLKRGDKPTLFRLEDEFDINVNRFSEDFTRPGGPPPEEERGEFEFFNTNKDRQFIDAINNISGSAKMLIIGSNDNGIMYSDGVYKRWKEAGMPSMLFGPAQAPGRRKWGATLAEKRRRRQVTERSGQQVTGGGIRAKSGRKQTKRRGGKRTKQKSKKQIKTSKRRKRIKTSKRRR